MQRFDNRPFGRPREKRKSRSRPAVKRGFVLGTEGPRFSNTKREKKKREPAALVPAFETSAILLRHPSSTAWNCQLKASNLSDRKFFSRTSYFRESLWKNRLKKNCFWKNQIVYFCFLWRGFLSKVFELSSSSTFLITVEFAKFLRTISRKIATFRHVAWKINRLQWQLAARVKEEPVRPSFIFLPSFLLSHRSRFSFFFLILPLLVSIKCPATLCPTVRNSFLSRLALSSLRPIVSTGGLI